jgi:hypothetical protein
VQLLRGLAGHGRRLAGRSAAVVSARTLTLTLLSDVANHLWQSTLVLGVAGALAWLLRKNAARVRFAIWSGASLEFLVPFAPLIAVGRAIGWPSQTTLPQPTLSAALNTSASRA